MLMRHSWLTKGMAAKVVAGSMERDFPGLGIGIAAKGDGWILGESGGALVLVQAMPINGNQSHVITVGVSNDEKAAALCDKVAGQIDSLVSFD